jgi:hypothetical protein
MGRKEAMDVLLCGDRELGELEVNGIDNYWIYGRFHPLPAFAYHAALFDRLEHAWAAEEMPIDTDGLVFDGCEDALQLQDEVNRLGLVVRSSSGAVHRIRDFKIQGGEYEYKRDPSESEA